ncbi:MAG TPA: hypothetical protein PKU74_05570, partial [Candidatus Omnitrophota bacterium]|nr:hypothetical protein [Candidatus Omnitrophota bacterium]
VVDYVPKDFNLENEVFGLSRKTAVSGSRIDVNYLFRTKRARVSRERYPEMLKVWRVYDREIRNAIILKAKNRGR